MSASDDDPLANPSVLWNFEQLATLEFDEAKRKLIAQAKAEPDKPHSMTISVEPLNDVERAVKGLPAR